MDSLMLSADTLGLLIIAAVAVTALAPVILLILWLKEHKRGQLW